MINVPVNIKEALRDGDVPKEYLISVLNDDGSEYFSLDNNNLVCESMKIDERMCSGRTFKFGLCEGSSLEFQYFDKPSMLGKTMDVFLVVDPAEPADWETAKYVTQDDPNYTCTGMGKVRMVVPPYTPSVQISHKRNGNMVYAVQTFEVGSTMNVDIPNVRQGDTIETEPVDPSSSFYITLKIKIIGYGIPMGRFIVDQISRQASTGIMKVTAYNKLKSEYLDQKANELILSQYSNPDMEVMATDIINLLLADYGIQEVQKSKTRIDINQGTVPLYHATTSTYTISNGYWIRNGTFYISRASGKATITLDPTKVYKIGASETPYLADIEAYEMQVYNWLYETMISELSGGRTTADAFMEDFVTPTAAGPATIASLGWHDFCGIHLTKENGTKEYYSRIASDHGLADVKGSINDLFNKSLTGYTQIDIFLPYEIWFTSRADATLSGTYWVFDFIYHQEPCYQVTSDEYLRWYMPPGQYPLTSVSTPFLFLALYEILNYSEIEKTPMKISDLPDITLRDLQSAIFETECQFGKLDRETDLFSGVELNGSRLLPADIIYPATNLYPDGAHLSASRSMYSKLWADEGNVQSFRYLRITYKGLDEDQHEKEYVLQRTVNSDGTQDYNCSDNWLFRKLIWTAAEIGEYADAMVTKMRNITWFPFEMWCAGLPYLETGDEIEIPMGENTYTSYVLQRTLDGIQNLQDTYINGELDIF